MAHYIDLECQMAPSWEDAKTRLNVASEVYEFPFYICMDETARATKDLNTLLEAYHADEHDDMRQWFSDYAVMVNTPAEALATLYPWFHDGEKMPERG